MKILTLFLASIFLFSGCSGFGNFFKKSQTGLVSYTAETFPPYACRTFAIDIVERLEATYPPGKTLIYLSGQGEGVLALALEDQLRLKGFSLSPEQGPAALTVAFTTDQLDVDAFYFVVNLSDGHRFARVYKVVGNTIIPSGSLSQGVV